MSRLQLAFGGGKAKGEPAGRAQKRLVSTQQLSLTATRQECKYRYSTASSTPSPGSQKDSVSLATASLLVKKGKKSALFFSIPQAMAILGQTKHSF
ncbi:hypothetical protein Dimus_035626 [Dionaea muscipula]